MNDVVFESPWQERVRFDCNMLASWYSPVISATRRWWWRRSGRRRRWRGYRRMMIG